MALAVILLMSGLGGDRRVKQFTRAEHGMHDHGELARDRDGRALEADLFLEFEAPGPQRAVRRGAREDHDCRLVQQSAQMVVAAPGYMTVVIDFARLVTPGRQADPGTCLLYTSPSPRD